MSSRLPVILLGLALPGLLPATHATEYPLAESTVRISYDSPGKQRLTIQGRWQGALPADPVLAGATLRIAGAYGEGGTTRVALTTGAWRALGKGRGYKYADKSGAAGGIRSIVLRNGRNGRPGRLRIVGGTANLAYEHRAPHTRVRVALEMGLNRWCALVDAPRDDAGRITGTAAAAPLACPAEMLVDPAWLQARLGHADVQVIDARSAYAGGHIPGALPLRADQLATTIDGIAFQMMPPALAEPVLSGIGLRRDATVVIYGIPPEYDAARVTWALHYLGHPDVRYLDGGWDAWQAAAAPVAAGTPVAGTPGTYTVDALRPEARVTGDWVLGQLGAPPYDASLIQLVDARSLGEYAIGRIPGAAFAPWPDNLSGGLLRPRAELEDLYTGLGLDPAEPTVSYCLVGWRASLAWLALVALGFEDVRVYDGSWLEWGAGGFPVETDP